MRPRSWLNNAQTLLFSFQSHSEICFLSHTINKFQQPFRPGKVDLLFRISHLLDLHVGGLSYSIFITSKCRILAANIRATAIKSGCVIGWKAIMTVEAAGLRGSGR